jgi:4-amino-4-deoxy-L-arabinose transferase-like glycosyltransferase
VAPDGLVHGTIWPFGPGRSRAILAHVNPIAASGAHAKARAVSSSTVTTLFCIAIAAIAVRIGWIFWHGPGEVGWDGAEYARIAANLASGHGYLGIRGTTQFVFPPFYSLTIAALLPFTADPLRAGVAVSLISGTALIFPAYGIASIVYGTRAGYAAGVIAAFLPFAVQLSTVVLADMLFLTLVTTGLFFLVRTLVSPRYADVALASVAFGLAYLTRPEGLLLELLAVAAVLVLAFARVVKPRRAVLLVLSALLPFTVLAAPYVAFLSAHAGHLRVEGKSIVNLDIGLRMDRGLTYTVAADAIDDNLHVVGPELAQDYYFEPAGRIAPSLSTILVFGLKNTVRHVSEVAHVAASRLCGSILLLALAIVGFAAGPWDGRRVRLQALLVAYGLVITVALASVFHFWDRYFVGYVPLLIVWSANGVAVLTRFMPRAGGWARIAPLALTALVLVVFLFSTKTGFTDDDGRSVAERQAGNWLAQNGGENARIASISDQAVYYAKGIWFMLPWAPSDDAALRYMRGQRPDFIVLDLDDAIERPYITAWMKSGVPDPRARVVYTVAEGGTPTVEVVRLNGAGNK